MNKCPLFIVLLLPFIQHTGAVVIKATDDDKQVTFTLKQEISLSCNLSESVPDLKVKWRKEDVPIESISDLNARSHESHRGLTYTLKISKGEDRDAGYYTCVAELNGQNQSSDRIRVISEVDVKVSSNINVVEGERLRIHCQVVGNPPPTLTWYYANTTYIEAYPTNGSSSNSSTRVILEEDTEKNIQNAYLRIDQVGLYDRGNFTCIGHGFNGREQRSTCYVRIKDKYAALWPFLGICAEVFILCAIIFIYEKKRNKTELEESDTDQSPDQKNTPDHEKDSNLRHRQ